MKAVVETSVMLAVVVMAFAAVAGTASSNEFKLDCRTGLRTAVVPEHIQYSTAWATNLTAAQQGEARAVVKVNPCLKTPPKYLVVDMSGGRSAARWPISYLDEVPEGQRVVALARIICRTLSWIAVVAAITFACLKLKGV